MSTSSLLSRRVNQGNNTKMEWTCAFVIREGAHKYMRANSRSAEQVTTDYHDPKDTSLVQQCGHLRRNSSKTSCHAQPYYLAYIGLVVQCHARNINGQRPLLHWSNLITTGQLSSPLVLNTTVPEPSTSANITAVRRANLRAPSTSDRNIAWRHHETSSISFHEW